MGFYELRADQFEDLVVRSKMPYFILFYAPWCDHCKKIAPNWKTFTMEAGNLTKDIMLYASVDCANQKQICDRLRIPEYPSLYVFENKKMYKYDKGSRPDLYEEFSIGEGFRKLEGMDIPTSDMTEVEQWRLVLRYYKRLLTVAFELHPLNLSLYLLIGTFTVFGTLFAVLDVLRFLLRFLTKGFKKVGGGNSKIEPGKKNK